MSPKGHLPKHRQISAPKPSTKLSRAEEPLILTIDIGSSSIRSNLFDRLGRLIEDTEARRDTILHTAIDGKSEADPNLIIEHVSQCLDETVTKAKRASAQIKAVASCTLVSNILGVDQKNRAITPLFTYADTRAEKEILYLKQKFDEKIIHDRTGCPLHSSYLPAKMLWLYRTWPDLGRKVKRWVSIGEYLELKLFGFANVSYSVASWTGLLNRRELIWDDLILQELPIDKNLLSPLTDINVPRYGLRRPYSRRWPALKKIPWFPAIGDGAAANIGSGCLDSQRLALTMGTTSALRIVLNEPLENLPAGLWNYLVDKRRTLLGGALSEGGIIYSWMQQILNLQKFPNLEKALSSLPPDSHGLTILPFISGERAPGWASQAKMTIHGLSLASNPLHILGAGLEAVAYRLAQVFELIQSRLPSSPQIIANGRPLLQSPTWLKIITDVLGKPLCLSAIPEPSARGAALLALESLGLVPNLASLPDFLGKIIQPDLAKHDLYQKAIARQKSLYAKLVKPG